MKKVTVGVVLFGTKYLADSLPSLLRQSYSNIEFIFRDQEEGKWSAYQWISENMKEVFEKARVEKGENIFHSGGHNAIINSMTGEYYFCLSQDMLYSPNFVREIVGILEENSEYAFAAPKLLRWDYEHKKETDYIDSLGIGLTKWHKFYDIAQGKLDDGNYDEQKEIFGASGAAMILRKKALDQIKFKDEYFDQLLHYKNDCELSYRLQWAGQRCLYIPTATAWHDRQVAGNTKKSKWIRENSFWGEKIMLKKNLSKNLPLNVRMQTSFYHLLKRIALIFIAPTTIKVSWKIWKKRKIVSDKKRAMKRVQGAENKIVSLMEK